MHTRRVAGLWHRRHLTASIPSAGSTYVIRVDGYTAGRHLDRESSPLKKVEAPERVQLKRSRAAHQNEREGT